MIRVLVVEDSASMRELLVSLLQADGHFQVVGTAADGEEAVSLAARLRPDVITMDIHLPRLDGVSATRRIMAETPTPIVVVSASVREKEVGLAFEALQAGAVTVLDKPPGPGDPRYKAAIQELLRTVRLMAEVKVLRGRTAVLTSAAQHTVGAEERDRRDLPSARDRSRPKVIAIAASTGGPQAIQQVLQTLGGSLDVPLLLVQHISRGFAAGMAAWLSGTCPLRVRLAEQGDELVSGTAYLAPEDFHLVVTRRGTLTLSKAPLVGGFRPSANVLFESVAETYGAHAVGIILTGMGEDGAVGLRSLRAAGSHTIAQDEASSVVYGMPRAAASLEAAVQVLPLTTIGPVVRTLLGLGTLVPDATTDQRG